MTDQAVGRRAPGILSFRANEMGLVALIGPGLPGCTQESEATVDLTGQSVAELD